jgi:hypothetical protein
MAKKTQKTLPLEIQMIANTTVEPAKISASTTF